MKNISYAATIAGFILVIGGGGSLGVIGCAATSSPGFGDDDSGVTHSDGGSTHHDGGGSGNDGGGGGNDSGGGGGDCTAFCMKESAVTGCPTQSACEATCQMSVAQAGNCSSQLSAVLQCAATTGTIASCSATGQAMISGCNTQITALTACAQGGMGDGGMMNCGVMTANPTCTACIDSMCCSQGQACGNTPGNECINLSMCYAGCNMVQTCLNNCDTMHPNGTGPLNALGACLQSNCTGSCP